MGLIQAIGSLVSNLANNQPSELWTDLQGALWVRLANASGDITDANPLPVKSASELATTCSEIADVVVTSVATALPSLSAGPNGIAVDCSLGTGVVRFGSSSITTTRGRRLVPPTSVVLAVANANEVYVILESAATQTIQVSAV